MKCPSCHNALPAGVDESDYWWCNNCTFMVHSIFVVSRERVNPGWWKSITGSEPGYWVKPY